MNIQSLSICVPGSGCINRCKFCVSRMRQTKYKNLVSHSHLKGTIVYDNYKKRLEFARDNNCNTLMITGECEPQQNSLFLFFLKDVIEDMKRPFRYRQPVQVLTI